jgi:hypothetical protein
VAVRWLDVIPFNSDLSCFYAWNFDGLAVIADGILRVSVTISPVHKLIILINHSNFSRKLSCIFIPSHQEHNEFRFSCLDMLWNGLFKVNDHLRKCVV